MDKPLKRKHVFSSNGQDNIHENQLTNSIKKSRYTSPSPPIGTVEKENDKNGCVEVFTSFKQTHTEPTNGILSENNGDITNQEPFKRDATYLGIESENTCVAGIPSAEDFLRKLLSEVCNQNDGSVEEKDNSLGIEDETACVAEVPFAEDLFNKLLSKVSNGSVEEEQTTNDEGSLNFTAFDPLSHFAALVTSADPLSKGTSKGKAMNKSTVEHCPAPLKFYNPTKRFIGLDYNRVGELVTLEKPTRLFGGKMSDERQNFAYAKLNRLMETMVHFTEQTSEGEILETPKMINAELKHHQKIGLHWLVKKEADLGSMILGDEMGLGKTLQIIALIVHQKQNKESISEVLDFKDRNALSRNLIPIDTTLLVVPSSLIGQWEQEIKKFVREEYLQVYIYHGSDRTKSPEHLGDYDVVITSYSTVSGELADLADADELDDDGEPIVKKRASNKPVKIKKKKGPSILSEVCFNRIVLDESHNIKNRRTIVSRACCKLSALSRICLSGTPMHNELLDMFSLFRFMRLIPLSEEAAFKQFIANKYSREGASRMNAVVKAVLLRRTKDEKCKLTGDPVVNLPPVQYEEITLAFGPVERKIYDHMFQACRKIVVNFLEGNEEFVGKNEGAVVEVENPFVIMNNIQNAEGDNFQTMSLMLVLLLRLRQICNHFSLCRPAVNLDAFNKENGVKTEKKLTKHCHDSSEEESHCNENSEVEPTSEVILMEEKVATEICFVNDDVVAEHAQIFEEHFESTKMVALFEKLEKILEEGNDKCIIVSQWTGMLNLVEVRLKQKNISCFSITGQVKQKDRDVAQSSFNERQNNTRVLLLALTAGGTGLNLATASHMFLIDSSWNPQVEAQCRGRIHRYGQDRPVKIYKFAIEKTIEDQIRLLQKKKLELAKGVLEGAANFKPAKLNRQDMAFLFQV
uniref:Helicase ATP-binding domain-containing protein n=1 Tax=Rhabditophanes sp. KR3021 TaxID=114890 RepID=A0AC35UB61_9BILA